MDKKQKQTAPKEQGKEGAQVTEPAAEDPVQAGEKVTAASPEKKEEAPPKPKEFSLADAFRVNAPAGVKVIGLDKPGKYTPRRDPHYHHRIDMLKDVLAFHRSPEIALKVLGHMGTGKSSLIEQFHAELNLPLITVNAHLRMETSDFMGHFVLKGNRGMEFHYGPMALAAKLGIPILVDEWNTLPPETSNGLNTVLEGRAFVIPETDEVIVPKPGFKVYAACNPNDGTGVYQGRNRQDGANDDRYMTIWVHYMEPAAEIDLLIGYFQRVAKLDLATAKDFAVKLVEVANKVRSRFIGSDNSTETPLEVTMSTRTLMRWGYLMLVYKNAANSGKSPIHLALQRALTFREISKETRIAVHEIVSLVTGQDENLAPTN